MGLTPKQLIFVLVSLTFYLNVSVTNSQNIPNTNIGTGQQQQQYNYKSQPVQQQQSLYTSTNDQLTGASAPTQSHFSSPQSSSYGAIGKHAESHQHHSHSHYGGGGVDNGWKQPQTIPEYVVLGLPVLLLPALLLGLMYLIWSGTHSSHYGPDEWHTTNPGKEHHGHHGQKPHHGHGGHHERSLNDLTSTVLKSIEKP